MIEKAIEQEQPKITRGQLKTYRTHVQVSLECAIRKEERLKSRISRPCSQKLSSDKKARNLRRLADTQSHVREAQDMLSKIDAELSK